VDRVATWTAKRRRASVGLSHVGLNPIGLNSVGLDHVGLNPIGLNSVELNLTQRRARLVQIWVTVSLRGYTISVCNHPPRPTQPRTLSGMGNEYRPKGCEALRLGSKAGTANSTSFSG